MKTKTYYSGNNQSFSKGEYDPNTFQGYGSSWKIQYSEKTELYSEKLIGSNTSQSKSNYSDVEEWLRNLRGY